MPKTIDTTCYNYLKQMLETRKYCRVQFFTDIHEFITTTSIIKQITTKDEGEYIELVSGEIIRLDKLVRVNDVLFPPYKIEDFTCDC